jgi:hypothetical protein
MGMMRPQEELDSCRLNLHLCAPAAHSWLCSCSFPVFNLIKQGYFGASAGQGNGPICLHKKQKSLQTMKHFAFYFVLYDEEKIS